MTMKGVLDAAVNGGVRLYKESFFTIECEQDPNQREGVAKLKSCLADQMKILEMGLEVHKKVHPENLAGLHKQLQIQFENLQKEALGEQIAAEKVVEGAILNPLEEEKWLKIVNEYREKEISKVRRERPMIGRRKSESILESSPAVLKSKQRKNIPEESDEDKSDSISQNEPTQEDPTDEDVEKGNTGDEEESIGADSSAKSSPTQSPQTSSPLTSLKPEESPQKDTPINGHNSFNIIIESKGESIERKLTSPREKLSSSSSALEKLISPRNVSPRYVEKIPIREKLTSPREKMPSITPRGKPTRTPREILQEVIENHKNGIIIPEFAVLDEIEQCDASEEEKLLLYEQLVALLEKDNTSVV